MATLFRAHFSPPPERRNQSVADGVLRKPSSRLPTRAPTVGASKTKQAQHESKLAKRPSTQDAEKTRKASSRTERTPQVPMTAGEHSGRQLAYNGSVPRSSASPSAGISAPPAFRPNDYPAPLIVRTPSLVSGSSASTFESQRSLALRRKPSTIEKYAASKRATSDKMAYDRATVRSGSDGHNDTFVDSVLGISLPPVSLSSASGNLYAPKPSAEEQYYKAQTAYVQPMGNFTPPYAQSATPSTRYTDSPFSHAPTPSSASSHSPSVSVMTSSAPRQRQPSPTRSRPPVTRGAKLKEDSSRLGLPPVRESSTSSSASTVKPSEPRSNQGKKQPLFKTGLSPNPAHGKTSSIHRKPVPISKPEEKSVAEQPRSTAPRSVKVPPELAHLNVDPPNTQKPILPVRPSRDGTPNLMDHAHTSPVVQSNLPSLYTTYHKRTPSQETPISAASPQSKSRFGFSSKSSSRQPSPQIDSAISPPPSARIFARGQTPEAQEQASEGHRPLRKDSPAIGPVPIPSKSPRFPFFSRRPKADLVKPLEKPERKPRKGPVTGTGHEGYGRFGFRGRSGSTTSSASAGRSPSADSTTSSAARPNTSRKGSLASKDGPELDNFLKERLTPMVLRGTGSVASSEGFTSDLPPMDLNARNAGISSTDSSLSSLPRPQLLPSAMQITGPTGSPAKRPYLGNWSTSDSSDDEATARYPTLAARRSFNRSIQAQDGTPVKVPHPINTRFSSKPSSLDGYDVETSAWPQTDSSLPQGNDFDHKEGLWLRSKPAEAPKKPTKKWNFFQRAQSAPRAKGKERTVYSTDIPEMNTYHSPYGRFGHYAMLDPAESVGLSEVEKIMLENETSPEDSLTEERAPPKMVPYERRHNSLLPAPAKQETAKQETNGETAFKARPLPARIMIRQDSAGSPELLRAQSMAKQTPHLVDIPKSPNTSQMNSPVVQQMGPPENLQAVTTPEMPPAISTPELQQGANNSPRQPRLSPVGRIPRVVSRRDRDRKLPDNSFSRPFVRSQPKPTVKPPGSLYNQIRELASPIESQSQPVSSISAASGSISADPKRSSNEPTSVSATDRTSSEAQATNDFLSFGQRKNSEQTYSSSSGTGSYYPIALTLPPALEEDIWHEYNDLIDEVMPQKTPLSAISTSSSLGAPFQYANMLNDSNSLMPTPLMLSPRQPGPPPAALLPSPPVSDVPEILSVPSQIARLLQPVNPPNTPYSISDFVAGYGDQENSRVGSFVRQSLPAPERRSSGASHRVSQSSSRYSRASGHSRSASLPEAGPQQKHSSLTPSARLRSTQLLDIAESESEQASETNLRFGAIMTSKWLLFGRVLISPAHLEMKPADEPRVLILDGLTGNDWSYYCAMSYPSAMVYNLAPTSLGGGSQLPSTDWSSLRNHRHIPHPSISAPFPFPRGFFTAVVFRFPIATSDQAYHACIFECKRVLRPGGHLEISVLDLDLMNMGSRTRKAVRGLKTRLQQRDQSVSLRNLSDVMMRLVGRRGFEEVQRCIVGVPAAGRIPCSQDLSSTSSGRSSSKQAMWDRENKGDADHEFSFADLLNDARGSRVMAEKGNDEGITKMVAKVGRWWYSTCYEAALSGTDRSIWNDAALLRECEKQGTSFRLLICYAQKPMCARRRTVSV